MLVITALQKRLLSSIRAFSLTLNVHRKALEKRARELQAAAPKLPPPEAVLLRLPLLAAACRLPYRWDMQRSRTIVGKRRQFGK